MPAIAPHDPHPSAPQAFVLLLVDALPQLHRRALSLTKSSGEADDLTQETAARALRFWPSFALGTNFAGWAQTIMTHTFIHGYRRERRAQALAEAGRGAELAEAFTSASSRQMGQAAFAAAWAAGLSQQVQCALTRLSQVQRQVVEACDLAGKSYAQAAADLGWPMGTVMSRLHRARRQLTQFLAPLAAEAGAVVAG